MRARDVMTRSVVTVRPETTVADAISILVRRGFTSLPVVDDQGELVGIVSEADIVGDRFAEVASTESTRPSRAVVDVMTSPVLGVSHDVDLSTVARAMLLGHRRSMPIVDGSKLIGIITRRDILRMLTRTDAEIADDVRKHLRVLGGYGRWNVQVTDGEVMVRDQFEEAIDHDVAQVLAEAVPGVLRATVLAGDPTDVAGNR
jgi:CBS domain-containing protein